ncbi:MAG: transpeptidase family protein [Odoribacteraceae bacterium]|jgi:cell division protein FtsI (penicillin-binding protein 3)|nr:transpeptidase family protein [Odoribacteraceae bacterium]
MHAMEQENKLTARVGFFYVLVLVVVIPLVIGKILYTQVWEGEYWKQRGITELVQDKEVMPARGNICAEDGRLLSLSIPSFTLYFDPLASQEELFNEKVDSLSLMLSSLFRDASPAAYREKIWNARYGARPNRYLRIGSREINYTEFLRVKQFPLLRAPKKKNKKEKKSASGLISTRRESRKSPYEPLAKRTIGAGYRDNVGLEEAYDADLRGIPGISRAEMLSGLWVPRVIKEPVHGYDVITTIDVDYQYIVHEALERQLKRYNARAGVAVLMEVKTGDVKAISNLSRQGTGGNYAEALNSAIRNAFEPGSVFKAATMIALLEDGYVHPDDTVDLGNGVYHFHDGRQLNDAAHGHVGKVTVQQMFEQSLNGISTLLFKHYDKQRKRFVDRLYAMQLNKKLDVEITGEGVPLIRYPTDKEWSGNTLPWMSIGYEVMLTPMQVLAFYNALANDGKRVKPRFVKEIRNGKEVVRRVPVEVVNRSICSRKTLSYLRGMLEGVVENGTARNLRGTSYGIAGKTGTARIADGARGYGQRKYLASFVGYFPAREPLYSCIVMIEDPVRSEGYYGNVVSGSVFREISDKVHALASSRYGEPTEEESDHLPVSKNGYKPDLLTLYDALDIRVKEEEKKAEWVLSSRADGEIVLRPRDVDFSVVPNARGMGLRDALYVLENSGLNVGVSGAGTVIRQTIEPGRRVSRGSYIHVELR